MKMIKCESPKNAKLTIEEPTGHGLGYLWIGINGEFVGSVESEVDLKRLKKMIDRIIANNSEYLGEL